ncbi:pimeloyl-ACP methyl ester carboxylesterase [Tamaricihabitans halophyticus]|uniref:Pimeloyl-ACP methyl ester carboxylesterase n=1 Tax=Tamaricihabitans halophyticus TaxID=1262583 RepID=A0A4V2SUN3_9PSEU|nr:alpha/beta hydrolase [Tamaricihabitans halophyticus]TCP55296.1 pimeloyl-ACP methyl ester carboxylesterase [Tamaricihabitans halophyticus]
MTEHISIVTDVGSFDAIAAGPTDGRPVLLLHGFPEAAAQWEYQLGALGANGFRVVAPDQRGYSPGVRPERAAEYAISELVADVLRIADELGWARFDLVGHDWGGAVAWWTAGEHPERLRTLTSVSTPHPAALGAALRSDEDQQLRSTYMRQWQEVGTTEQRMLADDAKAIRRMFEYRVPQNRIDDYVRRLSEPGALTAALNWYRAGRPDGKLGPVAVPTLYVWSTEDVALGSTAAFDTENWVTGPYSFQMLEDLTHWIPEEAPEPLAALLLEHLRAH